MAAGILLAAGLPAAAGVAIAGGAAGFLMFRRGAREGWLWLLVAALVLLPVTALVYLRPPEGGVQDSVLLVDAAARRLLAGGNPYGHDYIDSAALRAFWLPEIPVNPLLAAFPYPPGLLLADLPLARAGISAAWLWPAGLVAAAVAARAAAGRAGLVAVGLSPLLLLDGLSLFNDVFFVAAALGAWALIARGHAAAAGLLAGAALCLKQPAIVFAPPILWLAWRHGRLPRFTAGAVAVVAAACVPFLVWDARAFLTGTAAYFYGSGVGSFPIRGPGLEGLLLAGGAISSRWAAFPAVLVQAPALLAVTALGWWRLGRRPWLWAALLALAAFGLGRTLAPNYVTVIGLLLSLDVASQLDAPPAGTAVAGPVETAASHPRVEAGA